MRSNNLTWMLAVGALTLSASAGAQQAAVPDASAAVSAPAPRPSYPVDGPVTAPKVVCHGDELSITAKNSTLNSVLAELRRCMGTRIDVADGEGDRRVFDQLGPGPAREVISDLLSDSGFNFIIGSSETDPDKIETVMLMARTSDTPGSLNSAMEDRASTANRKLFLKLHQNSLPHPGGLDESEMPAAAPTAAAPASDDKPAPLAADAAPAAGPTDSPVAPITPAPLTPATGAQPVTTSPSAAPASSTQQGIANMQQLFEQRKQMMQQIHTQPQP